MNRKELKILRKSKMTLEQLSERTGISVSQLSRFESGDREPRVSEVVKLAQALNVEIGALFPEISAGGSISQQSGNKLDTLLQAVEGAFEMLGCDKEEAAALLGLVLEVAGEHPTPSAGPDFHRVLSEREARKFLQSKRLPHDGA